MDARASTAMDAGLGAACTLSVHGEFDMGTARSSTWLQPCDTHRYVHVNLAAAAFIDAAGLHGLVGAARRGRRLEVTRPVPRRCGGSSF